MTWQIHQILLTLHILLAITWVGGILFTGWGGYPASKSLPLAERRLFLHALMKWTHKLFTLAGIGVIATGILLGTVVGPIKNWHDIWYTTYGNIWVTALIVAIFTLAWGIFIGYRQSNHVFSNNDIWEAAENGDSKPLQKAMTKTVAIESVEVAGFMVLIVFMVML